MIEKNIIKLDKAVTTTFGDITYNITWTINPRINTPSPYTFSFTDDGIPLTINMKKYIDEITDEEIEELMEYLLENSEIARQEHEREMKQLKKQEAFKKAMKAIR